MSHDPSPAMGHGYEPGSAEKGFNYRFVYIAIIATIVVSIVIAIIAWPLVQGFNWLSLREETEPVLEEARQIVRPAGPLLQADPEADLQKLLERDRRVLESYGWVDEGSGLARVPVDRAAEMVLEDGLEAGSIEPASEPTEAAADPVGEAP